MVLFWVLVTTLMLVVGYFVYNIISNKYWKDRGVPHAKIWDQIKFSFRFMFLTTPIMDMIKENYNKFPNDRYERTIFNKNTISLLQLVLMIQILRDFPFLDTYTSYKRRRLD